MSSSAERTPELSGRVCLVTGASAGIGFVTALELARRGAEVVIANRPGTKSDAALLRLRSFVPDAVIDAVSVDFSDLAMVVAAADAVLARGSPVHVLVNNAGLAGARGVSKDGFEIAFAVNHLGPYLFTRRLLDRMRASAPARIVNVSSRAHRRARGIDWTALQAPTRSRTGLDEYAVSKLCNILFSRELGRRLAGTGVTTYALHPGVVATDIWRRLPRPAHWLLNRFFITPEEGARTTLHCATSPALASTSGRYYEREGERRPSAIALDEALAARLWDQSERFVERWLS